MEIIQADTRGKPFDIYQIQMQQYKYKFRKFLVYDFMLFHALFYHNQK